MSTRTRVRVRVETAADKSRVDSCFRGTAAHTARPLISLHPDTKRYKPQNCALNIVPMHWKQWKDKSDLILICSSTISWSNIWPWPIGGQDISMVKYLCQRVQCTAFNILWRSRRYPHRMKALDSFTGEWVRSLTKLTKAGVGREKKDWTGSDGLSVRQGEQPGGNFKPQLAKCLIMINLTWCLAPWLDMDFIQRKRCNKSFSLASVVECINGLPC